MFLWAAAVGSARVSCAPVRSPRWCVPPHRPAEYQEEEFVHALGDRMFNGEPERAGQRILKDFRTQALGKICLELPSQYEHMAEV